MRMNFIIDWLEFTYFVPESDSHTLFQSFEEEFPELEEYIQNMVLLDYGKHGYTHCLTYTDDFMIWYNPEHERMGVHVVFPGHGMHKLCEIFKLGGLEKFVQAKDLFALLKSRHCRITRMDIAYDDFEMLITPHEYARWMLEGRVRTKARTYNFVSSQQAAGGTFYLGKRGAERYIRIYDKNFESKGKVPSIRYEFELRGAWCQKIFDLIMNDSVFTFKDLISDYFEIVEAYNNISGSDHAVYSRKKRAALEARWLEFLELCGKVVLNDSSPIDLHIPREKTEYSMKKCIDWVAHQLSPSLFLLLETIGIDRLEDLIRISGRNRLKKEKIAVMSKYKSEADDLDKMIRDSNERMEAAIKRTREEFDSPDFMAKVANL